MSRKAANFTKKDIDRVGKWAMEQGLKALIIEVSSEAKFIVPLDKDFNVKGILPDDSTLPDDEKLDDRFTV